MGSIMRSEAHSLLTEFFTSFTATIRHHAFQPRMPTTSRPVSISADALALHLREDRGQFPTINEPRKCIKSHLLSLNYPSASPPCELFNRRCHPIEVSINGVNRVGSLKNREGE